MSSERPRCPFCTSADMVRQHAGPEAWLCYGCSRAFDAPEAQR